MPFNFPSHAADNHKEDEEGEREDRSARDEVHGLLDIDLRRGSVVDSLLGTEFVKGSVHARRAGERRVGAFYAAVAEVEVGVGGDVASVEVEVEAERPSGVNELDFML